MFDAENVISRKPTDPVDLINITTYLDSILIHSVGIHPKYPACSTFSPAIDTCLHFQSVLWLWKTTSRSLIAGGKMRKFHKRQSPSALCLADPCCCTLSSPWQLHMYVSFRSTDCSALCGTWGTLLPLSGNKKELKMPEKVKLFSSHFGVPLLVN